MVKQRSVTIVKPNWTYATVYTDFRGRHVASSRIPGVHNAFIGMHAMDRTTIEARVAKDMNAIRTWSRVRRMRSFFIRRI